MSSEILLHLRVCNHCFLCRNFVFDEETIARKIRSITGPSARPPTNTDTAIVWDLAPYHRLSYQRVKPLGFLRRFIDVTRITAMPRAGRGLLHDSCGICDYYSFCGCKPLGTINVAHVDCWKVANKRHSTPSLLHLARRASLLFDGWQYNMGFPRDVDTLHAGLHGVDPSQETHLGLLLARVAARLPPELQAEVLESIAGDPILRPLVAARQVSAFLTWGETPGLPACELQTCPDRLCASTRGHHPCLDGTICEISASIEAMTRTSLLTLFSPQSAV